MQRWARAFSLSRFRNSRFLNIRVLFALLWDKQGLFDIAVFQACVPPSELLIVEQKIRDTVITSPHLSRFPSPCLAVNPCAEGDELPASDPTNPSSSLQIAQILALLSFIVFVMLLFFRFGAIALIDFGDSR